MSYGVQPGYTKREQAVQNATLALDKLMLCTKACTLGTGYGELELKGRFVHFLQQYKGGYKEQIHPLKTYLKDKLCESE